MPLSPPKATLWMECAGQISSNINFKLMNFTYDKEQKTLIGDFSDSDPYTLQYFTNIDNLEMRTFPIDNASDKESGLVYDTVSVTREDDTLFTNYVDTEGSTTAVDHKSAALKIHNLFEGLTEHAKADIDTENNPARIVLNNEYKSTMNKDYNYTLIAKRYSFDDDDTLQLIFKNHQKR